jgi:hypothetical protein
MASVKYKSLSAIKRPPNVHFKKSAYITYMVKIITSKFTGRVNLIKCNMSNTKLFKIFNNRSCFFIISTLLILMSCKEEKPVDKKPRFLIGQWKFISIETNQTQMLDSNARQVYELQLKAFTNESGLNIQDSTYTSTLGQAVEKGLWKYHPTDSILSLKSQISGIQMFKVNYRKSVLILRLKNSGSDEYWVLKK